MSDHQPTTNRDSLVALTSAVDGFRDERDWHQFNNAKDMALSISLEAAELLEVFQWKTAEAAVAEHHAELLEELADVLIYSLELASDLCVHPGDIILAKLAKNAEKYPVDAARGNAKKYTELGE
ncbi:NTP pyrophosphatase (non-canonical NTP hydrolase) [Arcanobacterium wilhelmae]|uniref:NTP pyrophosphatase (Non-canonical NTP hydrolase) n=1 Tax=Arcanobacterium wilhelmae TaxID=1803177 RepID=A0ABT9NBD5_9ACTO|nr:nucleotide pyrophosphohydrolase [Arcanobacterium wilhelmae]MDP9801023.1 NTP pyrophosphatase (non-canonical NTP hydrolase) [Arcanobacterium wilhelmae]WFN90382.1 nucleotide pyrophosphohydrolase [Arcanobacterium wilhelmae]